VCCRGALSVLFCASAASWPDVRPDSGPAACTRGVVARDGPEVRSGGSPSSRARSASSARGRQLLLGVTPRRPCPSRRTACRTSRPPRSATGTGPSTPGWRRQGPPPRPRLRLVVLGADPRLPPWAFPHRSPRVPPGDQVGNSCPVSPARAPRLGRRQRAGVAHRALGGGGLRAWRRVLLASARPWSATPAGCRHRALGAFSRDSAQELPTGPGATRAEAVPSPAVRPAEAPSATPAGRRRRGRRGASRRREQELPTEGG